MKFNSTNLYSGRKRNVYTKKIYYWIVFLPHTKFDFDENYVDSAVFDADSENDFIFLEFCFFQFFSDFLIFFTFRVIF